jgi:SAM-dependent methyltransferase
MRLRNHVPDPLKPLLRPLYFLVRLHYRARSFVQRQITRRPKAKQILHEYWKQPWDGFNLPESYLDSKMTRPRSQLLTKLVRAHATQDMKILEIGCGVGRNLNYLFQAGFRKLEGLEISAKAIDVLRKSYPDMALRINIYHDALEDKIEQFEDGEFDLVYTMAVLSFIHTDSEWTFKEIARIAKSLLIVIEDEKAISWRHFPRNYKSILESLGMSEIEEMNCGGINGLGPNYVARVFKKREHFP